MADTSVLEVDENLICLWNRERDGFEFDGTTVGLEDLGLLGLWEERGETAVLVGDVRGVLRRDVASGSRHFVGDVRFVEKGSGKVVQIPIARQKETDLFRDCCW